MFGVQVKGSSGAVASFVCAEPASRRPNTRTDVTTCERRSAEGPRRPWKVYDRDQFGLSFPVLNDPLTVCLRFIETGWRLETAPFQSKPTSGS